MKTYVLLIKYKPHLTLKDVLEHLKLVFPNDQYMFGFLDGYLFGEYDVIGLTEFEYLLESHSPVLSENWVKFVRIEN